MANSNVKIGLDFQVNSIQGIEKLRSSLQEISRMSMPEFKALGNTAGIENMDKELLTIRTTALQVGEALDKAFNPQLGTLNVSAFNTTLGQMTNRSNQMGLSIQEIYSDFSKLGPKGKAAFQQLSANVLTSNMQLEKTHTVLDKIGTTFANTIKWTISSSLVNSFANSVRQAYDYTKDLDESLNSIRIVTGKSADEMERFAKDANDAARGLGATTLKYTDAALTFYQQGLSDEEVAARTNLTLKVSNASGLSAEQSAEYVTSVLNGYKVGSEEAEKAMDILANVGAHTASSLSQLSEAMSKNASIANIMGVSEEKLAAILATTIQTTRQSASTIGSAYKTILMRISDIKAGTDDAEVSLGEYTGKMAALGFNVLDETGKLRDMGDVIEEIGNSWDTLSREQQVALARTMAGTRQANNLLALFENWSVYTDALDYANTATGTLQKQQDIYMDSIQAHLNQLKTAKEGLYDSLFDEDTIKNVADSLAFVFDRFNNFVQALGGGGNTLLAFGSLAMNVFSSQIGRGLGEMINNAKSAIDYTNELKATFKMNDDFKQLSDPVIQQMAEWANKLKQMQDKHYVTPEQAQEINELIKNYGYLNAEIEENKAEQEEANKFLSSMNLNTFNFEKATDKSTQENYQQSTVALDELIDATQNAEEEQQNFNDILENATTTAQNYGKAIQEATTETSSILDASGNPIVTTTMQEKAPEIDDSAIQAFKEKWGTMLKLMGEDLNNKEKAVLENVPKQVKEDFEQAITELSGLLQGKSIANITPEDLKNEEVIKSLQNVYDQYTKIRVKIGQGAIKTKNAIENAAEGASNRVVNQANIMADGVNNGFKKIDTQAAAAAFARLVGSVGQVVSSINTARNLIKTLNDDNLSSVEKWEQSLTGVISTATSLMFAFKGVTAAAESAATAGIIAQEAAGPVAWAITAIVAAIAILAPVVLDATRSMKELENEAKKTQEEINKLAKDTNSTMQTFRNNKKTLSEIKDTMLELSTGVSSSGKNISLTNEQYQEFLDTQNQLAELFPDMVKYYDNQGNAVLDLSYTVNGLTNSFKNLEEQLQQTANEKVAENLGKTVDQVKKYEKILNQKNKGIIGWGQNTFNDIVDFAHIDSLEEDWWHIPLLGWAASIGGFALLPSIISANVNEKGVKNIATTVAGSKSIDEQIRDLEKQKQERAKYYSYIQSKYPDKEITPNSERFDEIDREIQKLKAQKETLKELTKPLNTQLAAFAQSQNLLYADSISKIIENVDFSSAIFEDYTKDDYEKWIQDLSDTFINSPQLATISTQFYDKITQYNTGQIDFSGLQDFYKDFKEYLDSLDIDKETKKILLGGFTSVIEDTTNKIDNILARNSEDTDVDIEELQKYLEDLSKEELEIAYRIYANGMSIEDLQKAITGLTTEIKFKTTIEQPSFSDTYKDIEDKVKPLASAYETLNKGEKLSIKQISELLEAYPDLIDNYDEATGSINGGVDALEAQFEAIKQAKVAQLEATKATIIANAHEAESYWNKTEAVIEYYNAILMGRATTSGGIRLGHVNGGQTVPEEDEDTKKKRQSEQAHIDQLYNDFDYQTLIKEGYLDEKEDADVIELLKNRKSSKEVIDAKNTAVTALETQIKLTESSTWQDYITSGSGSSKNSDTTEKIDFLETKLNRLSKASEDAEASIEHLFSAAARNNALSDAISKTKNEIAGLQTAADIYKRRFEQAAIPADFKRKIINGEFNLNEYELDSDTAKVIQNAQDNYEKYIETLDKIDEKSLKIKEDYKQQVENILEELNRDYSEYTKDAEGIINLFSNIDTNDEEGNLTEYGLAQLSLLSSSLDKTKDLVIQYKKEYDELTKNEVAGIAKYGEKEYFELRDKIKENYQNAVKDEKSTADKIINIMKTTYEKEKSYISEVIAKRKEALQKKKEYYDYDKKIKSKTKDVQALRAQVDALRMVSTAEARAQKARLEADLADAQDALDEEIQQHTYDITIKGLDSLQEELEDIYGKQIENITTTLDTQGKVIEDAYNLVSTSTDAINNILHNISKTFGIDETLFGISGFTIPHAASGGIVSGVRSAGDDGLSSLKIGETVLTNDFTKLIPSAVEVMSKFTNNSFLRKFAGVDSVLAKTGSAAQSSLPPIVIDKVLNVEGNVDENTVTKLEKMSDDIVTKVIKKLTKDFMKLGWKKTQ